MFQTRLHSVARAAVRKARSNTKCHCLPSTGGRKGFETTKGYPLRAFFVRRITIPIPHGRSALVESCGHICKKVLAVFACRLYNTHIAPVAQWIEQWPPEPCAGVRFPSGAFERQEFSWRSFPILKDSCLCELI